MLTPLSRSSPPPARPAHRRKRRWQRRPRSRRVHPPGDRAEERAARCRRRHRTMQRSTPGLIVGPHQRDLARESLRGRGQFGLRVVLRDLDDGVDAVGHPEAVCEHPWVQGSHARRVGRQPPGSEASGALLVGPERRRDTDGDTGRRGHLGTSLALLQKGPPVLHTRSCPQERRPPVGQLSGEPDRARRQRRQHDRHGHIRDHAQAQRSSVRRWIREPIPTEKRSNGRERLAQSREWPVPCDAVKALGQRGASGADAEREPTSRARCRPAAPRAIVAGVRPHAEMTDVPRSMREVRSASPPAESSNRGSTPQRRPRDRDPSHLPGQQAAG